MAGDPYSQAARDEERRNTFHEADVVVVGAGIFGCAVAFALANQGRSVILLERWMHEPNRIVGELLQPGGVRALQALGLEKCLEDIDAIPCYGYHVLFHGDDVMIPYPVVDGAGRLVASANDGPAGSKSIQNGGSSPASGGLADGRNGDKKSSRRPEGRSFHHGRFISQLRKACRGHPNISMFETEVTATVRGKDSNAVLGVETRTTDKETGVKKPDCFFGTLTIIADGYASKFRKELLGRAPVVRSKFYALELIDCPIKPQGYGHVVIGASSPVLLYQIGTHETRALIDVPEKLPAAAPQNGGVRGYIEKVVVPVLPEEARPSVLAALADGKIPRSMPNSWLPPTRQAQHQGVLLFGDAYNMRHPLTGGGMTVAFNDVVLLQSLLHPDRVPDLGDHAAVKAAMADFYWRRKPLTSIINVLAQALYSLFAAADDRQLRALRQGCFRYFQLGHYNEPAGLLGGLIHRPTVLAYHFFTVAFLGIWLNIVAVCGGSVLGLWKLPLALLDAVLILWKACVVFLPTVWMEST
ncbi:squalene epoxidase-domain-containing protein [Lasiosphaeria ovina]|uniref:Squalene monooxygenase n=1 Tax=Lasiosphaeria ovina TaxID=92902 RepID=A0AAE0K358_9PEZI|nr:squalene epoxidase-domain-containing protein [Lasiosphaeria ovina]